MRDWIRNALLILLGLVVALGAIGIRILFWGAAKDASGDRIARRSPVPAVVLPPDRNVYVALGDSYSAGEGVRPYLSGTGDPAEGGDRCHRSEDAYALQIRFDPRPEFRFRACSGAVVADMYRTQPTSGGGSRLGSQLAPGVLGPEVGLVTVTIGGNDMGFSRVVTHCATHGSCMDDLFDDSFDDEQRSGLTLRAWANRRLNDLEQELSSLYSDLRAGAPNARIIALGYPSLFPTGFGDIMSQDCLAQLAFGEAGELLDLQDEVDAAMARAATATGVEFVEIWPIFEGHEPCGGVTPRWIDFVPLDAEFPDPGSFHPNRNGHYMLARTISCYLALNPQATNVFDHDRLRECALHGI